MLLLAGLLRKVLISIAQCSYLEALDRDVKLPQENPSIGVLLCREKDSEVVEYTLSRSLSPAVVADYETKLIPKETLQRKLNELYEILETE